MTDHHGQRVRTRSIFRKKVRERGMRSITKFLVKYKIGDKVDIIVDSAEHKRGMPHKRFHGKTGEIIGIRGRCFEVKFKDINKEKMIIVGKAHIRLSNLN